MLFCPSSKTFSTKSETAFAFLFEDIADNTIGRLTPERISVLKDPHIEAEALQGVPPNISVSTKVPSSSSINFKTIKHALKL